MNNARSFFWIALAALGFLLWNAWQNDYQRAQPLAPTAATGAVELPAADTSSDLPAAAGAPIVASAAAAASVANTPEPVAGGEIVHVVSDVLELDIDTRGGTLTKANLRRYPVKAGEATPTVQLFAGAGEQFFVAQSGLVSSASCAH
jgi:YidC/Oxa1 family membrane protein insertase